MLQIPGLLNLCLTCKALPSKIRIIEILVWMHWLLLYLYSASFPKGSVLPILGRVASEWEEPRGRIISVLRQYKWAECLSSLGIVHSDVMPTDLSHNSGNANELQPLVSNSGSLPRLNPWIIGLDLTTNIMHNDCIIHSVQSVDWCYVCTKP